MPEISLDNALRKNYVSQTVEDELTDDVSAILVHSIIVSHLAYKVGMELGLSKETCYELAYAGILHDIGKVHLNAKLMKAKINEDENFGVKEIRYVRNHSIYSYRVLKEMDDISEYILDAVLYHHENYDGTGYPDGLNGNDIPEGARILRVCDVFAALVDRRIYRAALDIDSAVETMIDEVKNYDMKVFLAFQRVIHDENMEAFFAWIVNYNLETAKLIEEDKKKYRKHRRKKLHKMLKWQ